MSARSPGSSSRLGRTRAGRSIGVGLNVAITEEQFPAELRELPISLLPTEAEGGLPPGGAPSVRRALAALNEALARWLEADRRRGAELIPRPGRALWQADLAGRTARASPRRSTSAATWWSRRATGNEWPSAPARSTSRSSASASPAPYDSSAASAASSSSSAQASRRSRHRRRRAPRHLAHRCIVNCSPLAFAAAPFFLEAPL